MLYCKQKIKLKISFIILFVVLQAVEDVNRGICSAGSRLYQLKGLQEVSRAAEYLSLARTLPGYGGVAFPPARTDSRAHPAVQLTLSKYSIMIGQKSLLLLCDCMWRPRSHNNVELRFSLVTKSSDALLYSRTAILYYVFAHTIL